MTVADLRGDHQDGALRHPRPAGYTPMVSVVVSLESDAHGARVLLPVTLDAHGTNVVVAANGMLQGQSRPLRRMRSPPC